MQSYDIPTVYAGKYCTVIIKVQISLVNQVSEISLSKKNMKLPKYFSVGRGDASNCNHYIIVVMR